MSFKDNYPLTPPTLSLDFVNSATIDPRVTFSRSSKATYCNPAGLLTVADVNVPRIDYDPITHECKGLLIEEARTNLLTYSSEFDNVSWGKANATVTANAVTAPDGMLTAYKLVESATNAEHILYKGRTGSNETVTFSVYAKTGERNYIIIGCSNFLNESKYAIFNLTTGERTFFAGNNGPDYTNVSAYSIPAGNGWFRFIFTATKNAVNSVNNPFIDVTNGPTTQVYLGDGTSGIYIWGAQLEAGAFPTSYIPTTSGQVTRTADNASMTGTNFSSWYNQSEGTIAANVITTLTTGYIASIMRASGYGPRLQLSLAGVANTTGAYVVDDTATVVVSLSRTGLNSAFAYKSDDYALSANASVVTDTAGAVPTGIIQAKLGQSPVGDNHLNGHIKSIKYYPIRLTNAQLQTLTNP